MAILTTSKKEDRAILHSLWSSLVEQGDKATSSRDLVNRLFGLDYELCDICGLYGATDYEGDYLCVPCEGKLPTINDLVKMEAESEMAGDDYMEAQAEAYYEREAR